MNGEPEVLPVELLKVKNKVKKAELNVVASANPIFRERPINPETTLTSSFGVAFITEVPFETVNIVNEPAANATNGTSINNISRLFFGNKKSKKAKEKTKTPNDIAPNVVDFLASTFSANIPANGPIIAIARGGTTIRIPV